MTSLGIQLTVMIGPTVAIALVVGMWIARMLRDADSRARRRVLVATLALAAISVPIYWTRNAPDARRAALTSMVLREIVPVMRALPPGEYYAVALDYLEPGAGSDPEFLARIQDRAQTFSLRDGEAKALDLKLVRAQ